MAPDASFAEPVTADSPPDARLQRNWLWRILRVFFWLFCHSWLRVSALGRENIDNTRGGLFLINHQSFLDPLLVAVLLRRPVSYLARDDLFRVPVLGFLLRRTYVMPISREAVRGGSIRTAVERLQQGVLVGIFPEGTRSSGDEPGKFRGGFLSLVRRTDQPIYPVGLAGADRAMPRGSWFIRPCRIRIVYGQPFTDEEVARLQTDSDIDALAEFARQRVAECQRVAATL